MSPADARPENVGRRRSLALDRGEHDGRLVAHRDGGACAAVPTLMTMLFACAMIVVMAAPASAEPPPGEPLPATVSAAPRSDPWAAHIAEAARGLPAQAICLPLFATQADHVTDDLPAALSQAGFQGLLLPPVGLAPEVPAMIARAIGRAL